MTEKDESREALLGAITVLLEDATAGRAVTMGPVIEAGKARNVALGGGNRPACTASYHEGYMAALRDVGRRVANREGLEPPAKPHEDCVSLCRWIVESLT